MFDEPFSRGSTRLVERLDIRIEVPVVKRHDTLWFTCLLVGLERSVLDELRSLDPKLSATVVTVGITLRWTTAMTDAEVRNRLAEVPGLESIEQIR
jgi:hypothetical protein